jgi:hypothetical protein
VLVITSCFSRSDCTCCSRSAKGRGTIRFRDFAAESFTRYEGTWRVSTERDACNQCRRGTQRFNVSHTRLTSTEASGSEDFHGRRERSRQDGVGGRGQQPLRSNEYRRLVKVRQHRMDFESTEGVVIVSEHSSYDCYLIHGIASCSHRSPESGL